MAHRRRLRRLPLTIELFGPADPHDDDVAIGMAATVYACVRGSWRVFRRLPATVVDVFRGSTGVLGGVEVRLEDNALSGRRVAFMVRDEKHGWHGEFRAGETPRHLRSSLRCVLGFREGET